MSRAIVDQDAAQKMRIQRSEVAGRLRRLRVAAALGDRRALARLTIYKLQGAPCPNPDASRSIEMHLRVLQANLGELKACRGDPDLDGLADMICRLEERCALLGRLRATLPTASHP